MREFIAVGSVWAGETRLIDNVRLVVPAYVARGDMHAVMR